MATTHTNPPDYLGVGDSTLAVSGSGAAIAQGEVVAGSALRIDGGWTGSNLTAESIALSLAASGSALPGTWRAQQPIAAVNEYGNVFGGYFIRVS